MHWEGGLSLFAFDRVAEKQNFTVTFAIPGQNNMTLKEWDEKLIDFSTSVGNKDACFMILQSTSLPSSDSKNHYPILKLIINRGKALCAHAHVCVRMRVRRHTEYT